MAVVAAVTGGASDLEMEAQKAHEVGVDGVESVAAAVKEEEKS